MNPFSFTDCIEIKELIGKRADDETSLMELIEEVSLDSIYYHTHSYFLRHYYITGPFSNDFANWAAVQVRDKVLGEKLSAVTPSVTQDMEGLRLEIIDIIDGHLYEQRTNPAVVYGHPFYFMKSKIIEVPTNLVISDLKGFRDALAVVDASAIYNHIFEARLRVKKGRSDFAIWLEENLGLSDLAARIESIDAYMYSLEGLRGKILSLCEAELNQGN